MCSIGNMSENTNDHGKTAEVDYARFASPIMEGKVDSMVSEQSLRKSFKITRHKRIKSLKYFRC